MILFHSGVIVAFFTFVSRLFGLVRELCIAAIFGATNIADGVNVAFKLPNLFRRISAEGALSSVFIPIYNKKMATSEQSARHFSGEVLALLLIVLIILVLLIQIFMPQLMFIIAPGFQNDPDKFGITVLLCRITMPYLIFVSVAALFGSILNSVKKFAAFAFVPSILSISMIIAVIIYRDDLNPAIPISSSLIIAGVLQVLFMLLCLKRANLTISPILKIGSADMKKFLAKLGVASVGSGAQQLNLFISQSIASFIEGGISILAYADRIYQFPLSIIGTSFFTILLPELSKIYKLNDFIAAKKVQNNAIKLGVLLSLPATFGLILLSYPIIHIIYERGLFNSHNTKSTSEALAVFSLGLPAFVLAKILTPIFYANGDTKTPMRITILTLIFNTGINLIFMKPLEHVGIALGTSISAWYNLLMLYNYAKKYNKLSIDPDVKFFCLKVLVSCIVMSIVIFFIKFSFIEYFYSSHIWIKILSLGCIITTGIGTFFIMICLLKIFSFKTFTIA